jgi:hypothetical protein
MNAAITTDTILTHWPWIIAAWFLVGFVTMMPSPEKTGPTSSFWYRWLYGGLHMTIGALPRLIVTLFPQYSKFIPGGSNGTTQAVAASNSAVVDSGLK